MSGMSVRDTKIGGVSESAPLNHAALAAKATALAASGAAPSNAATAQKLKEGELLETYLDAIHGISAILDPHLLAPEIIKQTCNLLHCERASVFYSDRDELVLMLGKGAQNIRLPKNKGIAGQCATTMETINVTDAWDCPFFDKTFDHNTGFRTKAVLATPVLNDANELVAVLQCINKQDGSTFDEQDTVLVQNLATHLNIVLRNSQLYDQSLRAEHKVASLLDVIKALHGDANINSLIFTLSQRAHEIVDADRCTLYLADMNKKQLVVMQGNVDIRLPWDKGIAGNVCTTGQIVNIPDCYADPRFDRSFDAKTGYVTKSMLCMPIFAADRTVVGVLQLINRKDHDRFIKEDEDILGTLLGIAGPILKNSSFFSQVEKSSSHMAPEADFGRYSPKNAKKSFSVQLGGFAAAEEDDF